MKCVSTNSRTCVHPVCQLSQLSLLLSIHGLIAEQEGEVGLGCDVGRAAVPVASSDGRLTTFIKIAIQARAQMAADKEAVGISTVHMYESKSRPILPQEANCLFCP